jgi:hypothetical protein
MSESEIMPFCEKFLCTLTKCYYCYYHIGRQKRSIFGHPSTKCSMELKNLYRVLKALFDYPSGYRFT